MSQRIYLLWGEALTYLVTKSVKSEVFWVKVKEKHRQEELDFLYSGKILSFPNISAVKH